MTVGSVPTDTLAVQVTEGVAERTFSESIRLNRKLHELVPGGAHTYAKGTDQYPDGMAPVIVRGRGARVCLNLSRVCQGWPRGWRVRLFDHEFRSVGRVTA
jgi:hypothetical protein